MNLRSVFSARSDVERFDEEHASNDGRHERDERHARVSQQPLFLGSEVSEFNHLAYSPKVAAWVLGHGVRGLRSAIDPSRALGRTMANVAR